jgi:SAM-dependent methyltransferase
MRAARRDDGSSVIATHDTHRYGADVADDYDRLYGQMPETEEAVELLAELAHGGSVSELGIGTGRLALPLAARGLSVGGVDSSPEMVAQLRAKPGGDAIGVAVGDFSVTPAPGGPFAVTVIAFNTIFALADTDVQIACFQRVADDLSPGGRFVVEAFVLDPRMFHHGQAVDIRTMTGEHVELQLVRYDEAAGRVNRVLLNVRDGAVNLHAANDAYATPRELDLIARIAGFTLESRWADWKRSPFTAESTRHVSVYAKD